MLFLILETFFRSSIAESRNIFHVINTRDFLESFLSGFEVVYEIIEYTTDDVITIDRVQLPFAGASGNFSKWRRFNGPCQDTQD